LGSKSQGFLRTINFVLPQIKCFSFLVLTLRMKLELVFFSDLIYDFFKGFFSRLRFERKCQGRLMIEIQSEGSFGLVLAFRFGILKA
jgi:hypothetical protein